MSEVPKELLGKIQKRICGCVQAGTITDTLSLILLTHSVHVLRMVTSFTDSIVTIKSIVFIMQPHLECSAKAQISNHSIKICIQGYFFSFKFIHFNIIAILNRFLPKADCCY